MEQADGDILVIDDSTAHLTALTDMLTEVGYRVRGVRGGAAGLQAAHARRPDLILLDIRMPEMDGFEVCRAIRADPELAELPVIFITGLTDTEDKVRAFEAGGVDFISKPFESEEVFVRVAAHLSIYRMRQELVRQNDELRRLEEMQEGLTHMIVHDLRSPLSAILLSLQVLQMEGDTLTPDGREDVERAIRSTNSLMRMVNSLLSVTRIEAGLVDFDSAPIDLGDLIREAVDLVAGSADQDRISLPDVQPVQIFADRDLILRTVENLVGNALKYTPPDTPIRIRIEANDDRVRVEVEDDGPGIPSKYHQKIFEKFGQVEARRDKARTSTGLGLAFCKHVIDAHRGGIGVISDEGAGSTFWFELPRKEKST